ncbi:hypothetical protein B0T17DRAFT_524968 [Bombardia bombarda]|uniref:Aminoglycoside phosphotransferase domain-containing protein n=1 Tax=Bombardia bombarda TaxID=252184 RepID=A0AA39X8D9_9PEZI|nr:hypothetical protein B0T17DRAFT_524968 [Bombardia bombarda]
MTVVERCHVRDSIREIDANSWLIVGTVLLSRQASPSTSQPSWSDGKGEFFVISDAPSPLPPSKPISPDSVEIPLIYDAGDQAAVWHVGKAFIKAHDMHLPLATREHVTLEFLHTKKASIDFAIPDVLHHFEVDARYFLIVAELPGQTLDTVWFTLDEATQKHYISLIANIINTLASWKGEAVAGVDGQQMLERYFEDKNGLNLDPANLFRVCSDMGMDMQSIVFAHCDLGPTNILVDTAKGSVGIIDWEIAGYVPKDWVRTKMKVSTGLDLETRDRPRRSEWRHGLAQKLGEIGFADVEESFRAVFDKRLK